MALKKCEECGNDVSVKAAVCPHCGFKRKTKHPVWMLIFPLGVVAMLYFSASDKEIPQGAGLAASTSSVATHTPTPPRPPIAVPERQAALSGTIDKYYTQYKQMPNELKKSAVRTERGVEIKRVLKGTLRVDEWVGIIDSMGTTGEGKAYVAIKLLPDSSDVKIHTWNNSISDVFDSSLIPQGSDMFSKLSAFKEGDVVCFSGKFFASDGSDFIKATNITEAGSMRSPEFLFKFSSPPFDHRHNRCCHSQWLGCQQGTDRAST